MIKPFRNYLLGLLVIVFLVSVCAYADVSGNAVKTTGHKDETFPHMMIAKKRLEEAQSQLQKAARDFGGHRAKAADAVKLALDEIRQAIQYDKDHPGK